VGSLLSAGATAPAARVSRAAEPARALGALLLSTAHAAQRVFLGSLGAPAGCAAVLQSWNCLAVAPMPASVTTELWAAGLARASHPAVGRGASFTAPLLPLAKARRGVASGSALRTTRAGAAKTSLLTNGVCVSLAYRSFLAHRASSAARHVCMAAAPTAPPAPGLASAIGATGVSCARANAPAEPLLLAAAMASAWLAVASAGATQVPALASTLGPSAAAAGLTISRTTAQRSAPRWPGGRATAAACVTTATAQRALFLRSMSSRRLFTLTAVQSAAIITPIAPLCAHLDTGALDVARSVLDRQLGLSAVPVGCAT
jgi:hypothetical protein